MEIAKSTSSALLAEDTVADRPDLKNLSGGIAWSEKQQAAATKSAEIADATAGEAPETGYPIPELANPKNGIGPSSLIIFQTTASLFFMITETNQASTLNPEPVAAIDPQIDSAIKAERARQESHIELIASENFTYPSIMEAQGSVLTNKYAEGYPGKRYYGGCEHVDVVETIAIERAKELFGADHANVQPHAGSQANAAVYLSVLEPGDKILTMNLSDGDTSPTATQ